jgi:hypothetical protein
LSPFLNLDQARRVPFAMQDRRGTPSPITAVPGKGTYPIPTYLRHILLGFLASLLFLSAGVGAAGFVQRYLLKDVQPVHAVAR